MGFGGFETIQMLFESLSKFILQECTVFYMSSKASNSRTFEIDREKMYLHAVRFSFPEI